MKAIKPHTPCKLTYNKLKLDLLRAFYCAREHKANMSYVRQYEKHLYRNLNELCNELWNRTYKPHASACFIIDRPKKREVFAAEFRDRIVHHLIFNYIHEMLERTFVQDSYSCIKHKGTHYGINRLDRHIRQESQNYTKDCYILKMDIRGYFMHIDRKLLWEITERNLIKMFDRKVSGGRDLFWKEVVDVEFVMYLVREIILLDPTVNCDIHGYITNWDGLSSSKSLFSSEEGKGLPIGNLTSQLFSNVYLNELDRFMKRTLKCKHYGRYVDDFYVVSCDRRWLHSLVPQVEEFLHNNLGLELSIGKTRICSARYGVEFLGAYLKPRRRYISNQSLSRMKSQIRNLHCKTILKQYASVNSFLGILGHYKSYKMRRRLFGNLTYLSRVGAFDSEYLKINLHTING